MSSDATQLVGHLRIAVLGQNKDLVKANQLLTQLKIAFTSFDLIPPFNDHQLAVKQLGIAREAFELGAFLSIAEQDVAKFERHFGMLKPYYFEFSSVPFDECLSILPFECHTQLAPCRFRIQVDRHRSLLAALACRESSCRLSHITRRAECQPLIERSRCISSCSSRHRATIVRGKLSIRASACHAISKRQPAIDARLDRQTVATGRLFHGSNRLDRQVCVFVSASTVLSQPSSLSCRYRERICECFESSYRSLSTNDACSLLNCDKQELQSICSERLWTVVDDEVRFESARASESTELGANETIKKTLQYAAEAEKIL